MVMESARCGYVVFYHVHESRNNENIVSMANGILARSKTYSCTLQRSITPYIADRTDVVPRFIRTISADTKAQGMFAKA
jgi:hypothetical protein